MTALQMVAVTSVCLFTIKPSHSYHISESQFSNSNIANAHCELRCQSKLSVIEKEEQKITITGLIAEYNGVWVDDNRSGEHVEHVVLTASKNDFQNKIDKEYDPFAVCDHCNAVINKYIAIYNQKQNYDSAADICIAKYGTNLISTHSKFQKRSN